MRNLRRINGALLALVAVVLKLALFIPLPLYIIHTNLEVRLHEAENAALLVNRYERESAEALLSGQPLTKFDESYNERLLLQVLIENLDEPFETIALGSSHILQMTSALAGSGSFYNCGVSGADYRDVMDIFYLFDKANMLPENVIIGLDPWLLNADENMLHGSSDGDLFDEFLATRLGVDTGYEAPAEPVEEETDELQLYLDMLDIGLFQENFGKELTELPPGQAIPIAEGDIYQSYDQTKMPDGSILYPVNFREDDAETVESRAMLEATTFLRMDDYVKPDQELCGIFDAWVRYMQSRGINVILVMMPYHPVIYNYAIENAEYYPGFFLTEAWFRDYAESREMPIYGSYNPFITGMGFDDFYDGLHIKGEAISKIFPGMAQALSDAESYSVIEATQPMYVEYEVAERLVASRYAIYEPEVIRRGEDDVIDGEEVYMMERYQSSSPNAVRLARYAVVKTTGLIYRYDDYKGWVVDKRMDKETG